MSEAATKLTSGHTVHELDAAARERYERLLPGPWKDVVQLKPDGWIMLRQFLTLQEKVSSFKFRPDDVVVMTYPKCGTTWSQEIVWNMRNNPNLDSPDVEDALFIRSPYLECDMLAVPNQPMDPAAVAVFTKGMEKYCTNPDFGGGIMFQVAEAHTKPRTIKTHLAFSMLPKNMLDSCKVVYVSRNPKDNVLSAMHHYKLSKAHNFVGTQDDFVDLYVDDLLLYSPYGQHMREAWQRRDHPNLFMLTFEDLKKDTRGQLKQLDSFLGTKLTDQQIENVMKKTSFKNMQENDMMQKLGAESYNTEVGKKEGLFIRQGKAGTWRDKITAQQNDKLDAWIKTNFTDYGIDFKYE